MTNESKRDWGNLLTADDFDGFAMCCECLGDRNEIAEIANEIIRKELEKAPRVYQTRPDGGSEWWPHKAAGDTHSAHLICIKEIKRD